MAITVTLSNHYKYQKMKKLIDHDADVFKVILMNTAFAFDKDVHATYDATVQAAELSGGSGYTAGGETMVKDGSLTEDDTNDKAYLEWVDVQWDASGGSIGATGAAIVYDDTTADDTVVGCIDFGSDYTIPDGSSFLLKDISVEET